MGLGVSGTDVEVKTDKGKHPFPVARIGVMAKEVAGAQQKLAEEERANYERLQSEAQATVRTKVSQKRFAEVENQVLREQMGATGRRQAEIRRAVGLPPTVPVHGEQAAAGGQEEEGVEKTYGLKRAEYQGTGQLPRISDIPWQGVPGRKMVELKTGREPMQGDVIEVQVLDKGQVDTSVFEIVQKPINAEPGRDQLFVQWIGPGGVQAKIDGGKTFYKFEIDLPPGASLDASKAKSTLPGWVKQ